MYARHFYRKPLFNFENKFQSLFCSIRYNAYKEATESSAAFPQKQKSKKIFQQNKAFKLYNARFKNDLWPGASKHQISVISRFC